MTIEKAELSKIKSFIAKQANTCKTKEDFFVKVSKMAEVLLGAGRAGDAVEVALMCAAWSDPVVDKSPEAPTVVEKPDLKSGLSIKCDNANKALLKAVNTFSECGGNSSAFISSFENGGASMWVTFKQGIATVYLDFENQGVLFSEKNKLTEKGFLKSVSVCGGEGRESAFSALLDSVINHFNSVSSAQRAIYNGRVKAAS